MAVKATGYDKYVNYKTLSIAVGAFIAILLMPVPSSMLDVGVETAMGRKAVLDFYAGELFSKPYVDLDQFQATTARILEASMKQGITAKPTVLKKDIKTLLKMGIPAQQKHFDMFQSLVKSINDEPFNDLMRRARVLRADQLTYEQLGKEDKAKADKAAWNIKLGTALVAFVVICFVTEAIPLPGVAFCIGLILVGSGIVNREEVAALYWGSDACWFIMGSLMFAAAFVKTGVDKRICLILFRSMARPSIKWITAVLILVISPAAAFISDHALAAMFLPIAVILYSNSLNKERPADNELAKMLVICIAMACNIGGFGSPSGGARNVIIMTYLEDMFGLSMGYGQWILYGGPFVLIMMPILWVLINWRFKPLIKDLTPAMESLKRDISQMGGWNRDQIVAIVIFLVMVLGWITEKNLLYSLTGVRLGIGVIAVAGAMAYLLFGVVTWRDYQEKVDWGVVWLYAGAIIFGKILDSTGTAFWMARSVVETMAQMGLASGQALIGVGALVTAGITNLMADGPAAAAVGPITLNMAAIASPGTTLTPFMGLATACASSFAYLLIIGTPPNAIVYASGYLQPRDFLRVGIPCLFIAIGVLFFMTMVYWPLLGFAGLPSP